MNLIPWQKNKDFFTEEEKALIVEAIKKAEIRTSGEVRLYIESQCKYMDALDRAREIFFKYEMDKTELRNATLIYLAVKDHQVAVFGDEGINEKVGNGYWLEIVNEMLLHFRQDHLYDGICLAITHLGEALQKFYPYNQESDKNELPDEIIFGK